VGRASVEKVTSQMVNEVADRCDVYTAPKLLVLLVIFDTVGVRVGAELNINLLVPELFFLILAHPVYKM
jgi:hypothetical protein